MSTYTDASLIVTPNAYKAGKLYSLKPTDGAGDLDVVRATSATRVNEQGLIEIPRTNLLLRSEEFNVSPWGTLGTITITPNSTIAPNGDLTADLVLGADFSSSVNQIIGGSVGVVYTSSFFIKNNNSTQSQLLIRNASTIVDAALNWTGSVLSSITNTTGITTFQSYNNGWYRIMSTYTSVESAQRPRILPTLSTNQSVYIWGAQLEVGNVATEYIPTTSVIRTRFAGITQDGGSASNIPRLDYTNGSCPSILVEPQRTNLLLRSEEFNDVTAWPGSAGITRLANQATAPDGTNTMDLLTFPVSGNSISQSVTVVSGTTYTFSIWLATQSGTQSVEIGNINAGVYQSVTVTTTPKRFQITQVASSANRFPAVRATAVYSILIWGAQLEAGANATSYIPTVASSVTRNDDVISKSGISDLINSQEGVLFFNLKPLLPVPSLGMGYSLSNGTNSELIYMAFTSTANRLTMSIVNSNGANLNVNIDGVNFSIFNKIAIKWKQNELKVFINSVNVYSNLSFNTFSTNTLSVIRLARGDNQRYFQGLINSVLVFPKQLTDQQCISITQL